jgi:hypothetical protein
MPVFERHDPDLASLITYVVARSRERDVTLTQTKLVKLLYLVDIERAASGRPLLSGLKWVFFHYGPYALELPETLEPLQQEDRLIVNGYKDSTLYRAAPGAPTGEEWPPATRRQVDEVIRRYASLEQNELLDHVYFHTAPMRHAVRGQPLDMTLARSDPPPRPQPPLAAPTLPAGARERLQGWQEQRGRTLVTLPAGQPRSFFTDPAGEAVPLKDAHGQIVVPADIDP